MIRDCPCDPRSVLWVLFRGESQLLLVLLVGALVVGDVEVGGAAFEVLDAGAGLFDQVFVVGD